MEDKRSKLKKAPKLGQKASLGINLIHLALGLSQTKLQQLFDQKLIQRAGIEVN